jgi:hypothetical protein
MLGPAALAQHTAADDVSMDAQQRWSCLKHAYHVQACISCARELLTLNMRRMLLRPCLQEEVAQRLCDATPGRPDYRAMSIITHFYSKPVYRFK